MSARTARTLVFLFTALCSVVSLTKDWPPVETAYTQDGANCVRGRVRDLENRPVEGATVTLLEEKSLTGVAMTHTDKKGEFTFRTVPFKQELILTVEADGFSKASVPGITVVPPYSFVATVRLRRAEPAATK
jgi:hypothetical protein